MYRIVTNKQGIAKYWASDRGWTTLSNSELFDKSDIDVLLPHFYKLDIIASAISENATFKGFHLTGMAMIKLND